MSKMIPIPKGAIFYVSTGAYSDYTVHGVFRAIEEIDTEALLKTWLEQHPEQAENYHFEAGEFLASLTHLMEPIDSWEMFLGDYSMADHVSVGKCDNEPID